MSNTPDEDDDELLHLIPDHIPDWLETEIRKFKGTDFGEYKQGLEAFFAHTESLELGKFDRRQFRSMREKVEELNNLAGKFYGDHETIKGETWLDLVQDEYLALYKADPKFREPKDMKPTHRLNHHVMKQAVDQKTWKELRTYTELDEWTSAMAAVQFGEKLQEMFEEMEELSQAQQGVEESSEQVAGIIQQMQQSAGNGGVTDQQVQDLLDALKNQQQQSKNLDKQIEKNESDIRQGVRNAAKQSQEDIEDSQEAVAMFGTDPGMLQRMPNDLRIELAKRIQRNRKLQDLAKMVGRFVRLAVGEQSRKITHVPDEVYDVELGDALGRLLPSEFLYLSNKKTKPVFYKKYVEKQLMQYQVRGSEKVGKGAIICMIDSSGSMHGQPDMWAKALALAFLNIAVRQKRDFVVVLFGSEHDPLYEWRFEKGLADPAEVLDFAESFIGGGTDFMKPITRGVELLRTQYNDDGAMKGDLVFITDGYCTVTDEWLDIYLNNKEDLAFRMYSCLIGVEAPVLDVLSDVVYTVDDLAAPGEAGEMFGFV